MTGMLTVEKLQERSRARREVLSAADRGRARAVRLRAQVTIAEIAAVLGVSTVTVWRWEVGEARPRGELALKYANLLEELRKA